jgi:hypothetical protein
VSACGQLAAGDYCRGHRDAVRGHLYTGISMYDACKKLILYNAVTAEGAMTNASLVHSVDSSVAMSCQRMSLIPRIQC